MSDIVSVSVNGLQNVGLKENDELKNPSRMDFRLINTLSQFNREKIPERAVHARGAGAYGEFEVTHDISDICDIDMLLGIGKKTHCAVRFSTTALERGSPEYIRDAKGMAVKFFTQEGNWDWVCLNIPMFFIRDPIKFPALIHAQRPDPRTNMTNPRNWWEFVCDNHEALHMVMFQFSDFGTMFNYRSMSAYVGHAYKWAMPDGSWKYVHWFLSSDQGPNFENGSQANDIAPNDLESATRDLYESIERGEYPTWTANVQVVDPEDAHKLAFNILDLTKHWNLGNYPPDIPLIPSRSFGKLTLKRNPKDYFQEIEQLAFSPSHLVPGVEPSEDPMLQARLFAYRDAQRYRLGPHNLQLSANQTRHTTESTRSRISARTKSADPKHTAWLSETVSEAWSEPNELDYKYPREFWKALPRLRSEEFQSNVVVNMAKSVSQVPHELRERVYHTLDLIATDLADRVKETTEKIVVEKETTARL
uniref:Chanoclavine synthase catalase protein n=1 Tax=Epichloe mollis TaxID=1344556 RepID=S5TD74_9HYPO|nr:chanoclavine synthase catalase protein [Epichloe mollis]